MRIESSIPGTHGAVELASISAALGRALNGAQSMALRGRVVEAVGILLKATGVRVSIGEICDLVSQNGNKAIAEVVGFSKEGVLLMPYAGLEGISAETEVIARGRPHEVGVGDALLGRVLDGFGNPIDGSGAPPASRYVSAHARPPDPMKRRIISDTMPTGVRVIDGLLTLGEGQRVGIFAPAGAGKSSLLGMLARSADADVNVIALIGERGREVREFIEHALGKQGLAKSVCVVATSDKSALERTRAAYVATTIAEDFRARGQRVLLMMDSLTRFARGQRELGLASGEPPTRRGYPPSMFSELPKLLERAGQGECGSITALYTVLVEDEQTADPVAEEARSILDGHIILSRKIAAKNQYPAVDVLGSVSRVMSQVVPSEHAFAAGELRKLMAKYSEVELLVQIGEYRQGADRLADEAIAKNDAIVEFLSQRSDDYTTFDKTLDTLYSLTG
ncbi:type III secretion system ATPase SctN [Burkholderia diffusa]|uniref:type III secretion system ATPase SctN n=1 Tax=Burkholderia diffusa TaxID=488732 RepID=UPI0007522191|nr:type III secretion apparatus H+-transporting two-sector ATPase [Burkholderia diffusa]